MNLGFNYLVIAVTSAILLAMLLYALTAKILHEAKTARHRTLLGKYAADIRTLLRINGKGAKKDFTQRLNAYYKGHTHLLKTGEKRDIFEEALLKTITHHPSAAHNARKIAYRFGYAEESVGNLKSGSVVRRLRGCQQAGTYLYEPAIPQLLQVLHFAVPQLQYNALLAIADFKKPELTAEAFEIVEHTVLVNARTLREIVAKMGDQRPQLYGEILAGGSPVLVPMFLKFIDRESANLYMDKIAKDFAHSDDMEVRIAAIHALSETENKEALSELIDALNDDAWEVRAAAARGIGKIPGNEAYLPLLRAMGDSAWWVRQNAAAAALSLPNAQALVKKVLCSGDRYAIDSLYYMAEQMNKTHVVRQAEQKKAAAKTIRWNEKRPKGAVHA